MVLSQTRENSCHWLSHGDYTWRTPALAVLNSSLLRESHCHPLVARPIELITSKSLYPYVLLGDPRTITPHVCFPFLRLNALRLCLPIFPSLSLHSPVVFFFIVSRGKNFNEETVLSK